ncbi:hypothetical protein B0H13DRAFT_2137146 [Mycena leptocephala]|nr:hypothetical protein B0H13DRAFT_2137146 [Mycena leptocephala]
MIPLACPDRHVRTLPREPSSRTDLQLRDTRTELSNIVFRRGFFSWARSLLKWVPYASTAIGLFGLGECIWSWATNGATVSGATGCVLGGITTLYGIGGIYQANVAASLATATTNANFELVDVTRSWAAAGTQTDLIRRAENPTFSAAYHALLQNWTLPHARHHTSGKVVTLWDVARANSTHPITANHSHAVNIWSSVHNPDSGNPRLHFTVAFPHASTGTSASTSTASTATPSGLRRRDNSLFQGTASRTSTSTSTASTGTPSGLRRDNALITLGTAFTDGITTAPITSTLLAALPNPSICVSLGQAVECSRPGSTAQIQQFQADLGTKFDKENGFEPAIVDMARDIVARQAWDTCVCEKAGNTWISTGSIQMSWDNTYNGYSPCWNPDCDNDAMVPVVN